MHTTDSAAARATPHLFYLHELVEAANANQSVKEYRAAGEWWSSCWSEESITRKPPIRVEFEHAIVFATFSEALSLRRSKSGWGELLSVGPLRLDDRLHPTRVVYQLKASSKMRQRWEVRDTFKHILGKDRGLVNDAVRCNKAQFLAELDPRKRRIIWECLKLDADEFWRLVRRGGRLGQDGIVGFVRHLKECTEGYELQFPPS
jgi:hypothetical protein